MSAGCSVTPYPSTSKEAPYRKKKRKEERDSKLAKALADLGRRKRNK